MKDMKDSCFQKMCGYQRLQASTLQTCATRQEGVNVQIRRGLMKLLKRRHEGVVLPAARGAVSHQTAHGDMGDSELTLTCVARLRLFGTLMEGVGGRLSFV